MYPQVEAEGGIGAGGSGVQGPGETETWGTRSSSYGVKGIVREA